MAAPRQTISQLGPNGPDVGLPVSDRSALDPRQLFAIGLDYIASVSSRVWNDYNLHDPGITTLELLCYAITDLSYRASLPVADLLAPGPQGGPSLFEQFGSAAKWLPMRPVTANDYRKLLIDLPGVLNAWVRPAPLSYWADLEKSALLQTKPTPLGPTIREVPIAGLYQPVLELEDHVSLADISPTVRKLLAENRNLSEDFLAPVEINRVPFNLCAEVDLRPEADVEQTWTSILQSVERYFAPPIGRYSLAQMLERTQRDGTPYTVDAVLDGPLPRFHGSGQDQASIPAYAADPAVTLQSNGFIDDGELALAELKTAIRLAEVIRVIAELDGVLALRDIVLNPTPKAGSDPNDPSLEPTDPWSLPLPPSSRATLIGGTARIVFYKKDLAVRATTKALQVKDIWPAQNKAAAPTFFRSDVDVVLSEGTYRNATEYYSFQNHFPATYGLGEDGPPAGADARRQSQILQLKGYLLFFDQVMANYLAQLGHLRQLFSQEEGVTQTYYAQVVDSFRDHGKVYLGGDAKPADAATAAMDADAKSILPPDGDRRSRFLDHLIARFAERFHDFANILRSHFPTSAAVDLNQDKCRFLQGYAAISAERALAYDANDSSGTWDSPNVSGLEKRIAALLGIPNARRRDLATSQGLTADDRGMYLVEGLLLRPEAPDDPMMPICADPTCGDCQGLDPYTYRVFLVLPAWVEQFSDMDFRLFVERTIQQEVAAHILPRICWIPREAMLAFQKSYREWLNLKAGASPGGSRKDTLQRFIDILTGLRSVYPPGALHGCDAGDTAGTFVLNRTALGTLDKAKPGA